jgi:CRISPR/Cas system CSM-associated protein Csm3 (group 7 of RAMP superfamily)
MSVGVRRDHVRLTARGAAANRGKFDEALVPRGARFTFEIRVNGRDAEAELENLLNLLAGGLRLGGHTRRGFGSFKLVTVLIGAFDLCRSEDRQRYRRLDRRLDESVPADVLSAWQRPRTLNSHHERIELELTPEDFWLFGGGEPGPFVRGNREPDAAPVTEHMIVWDEQGRGQRSRLHLLVPGSSVKGALLHRTTFHALRLSRRFARSGGELPYDPEKPAHLEEVVALFGEMNDDQSDTGRPGRVIVDDVFLALPAPGTPGAGPRRGWLNHVSIDRFTQAPLDGKLFSESPMFSGKLKLSITVLPSRGGEDDSSALAAFRLAIADLCEGRLALGAAAGRGHGFFSGTVKASTAPWLAGQEGTR